MDETKLHTDAKMEYLPQCLSHKQQGAKEFCYGGKELGRKKKYYIEEFNPTCDLQQKEYIGANIPWGKGSYCSINNQLASTSV